METSRGDIARMLSPLLLFAAHVVYLIVWSPDPFFNKWIDGSFSFFVALVLCNIIRARVVAAGDREKQAGQDAKGPDRGAGGTPGAPAGS